jgi:hypothetical protein
MKAKKIAITSASAFVDLPNAQRHLSHYFGCSGSPLEIDLVSMVDDVPSAKQAFDKELSEAMTFVESLGPGPRVISSTNASQGFNRKSENKDWYYAIGVNGNIKLYQLWQYKSVPPNKKKHLLAGGIETTGLRSTQR